MENSLKREFVEAFHNHSSTSGQLSFYPTKSSTELVHHEATERVLVKYFENVVKGTDAYIMYIIIKKQFGGKRKLNLSETVMNSFSEFFNAAAAAFLRHRSLDNNNVRNAFLIKVLLSNPSFLKLNASVNVS